MKVGDLVKIKTAARLTYRKDLREEIYIVTDLLDVLQSGEINIVEVKTQHGSFRLPTEDLNIISENTKK